MIRPEDAVGDMPTATLPQSISSTGMERIRSIPTIPALAVNSPPRAANTEHGHALDDVEEAAILDARSALAAADQAIQIASGVGEGSVDDGWDSADSDGFLDTDDEHEGLGMGQVLEESSDEEELINLRGHI